MLGRLSTMMRRKGDVSSTGYLVIVSNRAGTALQLGEFATARALLETRRQHLAEAEQSVASVPRRVSRGPETLSRVAAAPDIR